MKTLRPVTFRKSHPVYPPDIYMYRNDTVNMFFCSVTVVSAEKLTTFQESDIKFRPILPYLYASIIIEKG